MQTPSVLVLGGGVAGMTAAHELAERGFAVTVLEQKSIAGGKARSMNVPHSATPGRRALPGEHGFRFFPRFYRHLPDTMQRIPYGRNPHGVLDNLTEAVVAEMAQYDKAPIDLLVRFPRSVMDLKILLHERYENNTGLSHDDLDFFAHKLWQLMTSCPARRLAEYEQVSWWDFVDADNRSAAFQTYLATGLTRTLVAAKAKLMSARTGGDILLQLLFDMAEPGGSSDRLLCGPTNDVWIDPWREYLRQLGVHYVTNANVVRVGCDGQRITGVTVDWGGGQAGHLTADYYVAALPVEVMAKLITPELLRADPSLANVAKLVPDVWWMSGIQFYLNQDVPINYGHTIYINTEWALTSISQHQFWPGVELSRFGNGRVQGILSVDVSDWFTPGELTGKPASQCSREEIRDEVWHQLKKSLNRPGHELLRDDMVETFFIDSDIIVPHELRPNKDINLEPLLVNVKGSWSLRPDAVTAIPNLTLAADYVRTYTDLATMEGANEAARRAVNGILAASGSAAAPCAVWALHEPALLAPWRAADEHRFKRGLPWNGSLLGTLTNVVAPKR